MPNYCDNEVTIVFGGQDDYDKFITQAGIEESTDPYLSHHAEENGYGFFDRFVPTPPELLEGEGWYDWRVAHWGTKWNPNIRTFYTDDESKTITLSMSTAWAPPMEFFEKFTEMFPSAQVQLNYVEEGMSFCGRAYIEGGYVDDTCLDDIPSEMYAAAGATLDSEGNVDWEQDQDYDLFLIVNDEDKFSQYA